MKHVQFKFAKTTGPTVPTVVLYAQLKASHSYHHSVFVEGNRLGIVPSICNENCV